MRQRFARFTAFAAGVCTAILAALTWSTLDAQSSTILCIGQDRVIRAAAGPACGAGERPLAAGAAAAPQQQQRSRTDDAALRALQDRVRQLELELGKVTTGQRIKAPFEVVDAAGKPILLVTDYAANLSRGLYVQNPAGGLAFSASVPATERKGGLMKVYDGSGDTTYVAAGAFGPNLGINIRRNDVIRMTLSKGATDQFSMTTYSPTGKNVAGIGESVSGPGVVAVFTPEGRVGATMGLSSGGAGQILVNNSSGVGVMTLGAEKGGGGLLEVAGPAGNRQVVLGVTSSNDGLVCAKRAKTGDTCVGGVALPGTLPGTAAR